MLYFIRHDYLVIVGTSKQGHSRHSSSYHIHIWHPQVTQLQEGTPYKYYFWKESNCALSWGCEIRFSQFGYRWRSQTFKISVELVSSFLLYHLGISTGDFTNLYTRRVRVFEDIFDFNTVWVCTKCKTLHT